MEARVMMDQDTEQMKKSLLDYLEGMSRLVRYSLRNTHSEALESGKIIYTGAEEFVLKEGQLMLPPPSNRHKLARGVKKECFKNATVVSMYSRMKYAEGFFVRKSLMIPIHHAWNVDEDGFAVDTTIGWDPEACFYGVVFDPLDLSRLILKNGYYGLLSGPVRSTDLALGLDPHFPYQWKRRPSTLTGDSHAPTR
jgi:hypothetical protein